MKKTIIRMMVLVAVIMALFSGMLVQAATTGRQRAAAVEKVIRHRYKRVKILNGDECQKDELEFMVSEFASDEAMAKLDQLKERLEMMED